ncbi:hypothetical protein [Streptomyces sp. NPDC021212]|uniref:hypothetical protein n=1 Tax=Streptomyces sp. NPDC021212 TaxID=3365118 RepID=UPI00379FE856
MVAEVHEVVAGLLDDPGSGRVSGDACDVHPPGVVVDEEYEPAPQEDRIGVEQVGGYDYGGLGLEESGPGAVHTLRRWVDPCLLRNGPDGGGRDVTSKAEELTVDAAVFPRGRGWARRAIVS